MKTTILLGILALSLSAVSQIIEIPDKGTNSLRKPDSSYTFQQSTENSAWQLSNKTLYQYTSQGHISQTGTWIYISSGLWQNQLLTMFTYDFDGYPTSILTKVQGTNSTLIEYEWDNANNLLKQIIHDWDGSAWMETAITTNEYENDMMISRRHTQLPASAGNYSLFSYTYNDNRRMVNMLMEYFENNQLIVQQQSVYEYDASGNCITELAQEWGLNGWLNVLKADYTYDNHGNNLSTITSTWQNDAWQNLSKQLNTYSELDYRTSLTNYYWDGSEWIFANITRWSYDKDNFLKSMVWKSYDIIWGQTTADSTHYYPQESLAVDEIAQSRTLLLYPNPGNGLIMLLGETPLESVEVYNLTGEKILTTIPTQRYKAQLDLSNQTPGVYVVKAKSVEGVAIGKVVIR